MATFSLGQAWITKITTSEQPDLPVMGLDLSPLPNAEERNAFLGELSRSEAVREISRRKWLKLSQAIGKDKVAERANALLEFLTTSRTDVPAYAMFKGRRPAEKRDLVEEVATRAWITHVTEVAQLHRSTSAFKASDITNDFIRSIAKLSTNPQGPRLALEAVRELGVCAIAESGLPGMSVDGVSFHTNQTGPVLAMTLRHDRLDNFWFTLFHELGHIRLHLSKPSEEVFVDSDENESDEFEAEAEANAFAKDSLVPRDTWSRSGAHRLGSEGSVIQLAKQLGVHPAIVAGRIRYERRDFRIFTDLIGLDKVRETVFSA